MASLFRVTLASATLAFVVACGLTFNNPVSPSFLPPAGLIGAWRFDEGSGAVLDSSGQGNDGTAAGGAIWTTIARYGLGMSLNTTDADDIVDLGNPAILQVTGSMTVAAWIHATSFPANDASIVSRKDLPGLGFQLDTTIDLGPRVIGFKLKDPAAADMARYGSTTLVANTWYHVAGVYNASAQTMHVYLNGNLDDGALFGTVASSQRNDSAMNTTIGQRPGGPGTYPHQGYLDNVRIYGRALSRAEVRADMKAP